ncbi:MAG: rhomboid family intramembrane serine protease [Bacteroidales bacterium]|nr:rhomboid family intramembrane serine protease [Bacteroidales bacterium]MCF8389142.1 rhomboid family intramembrane serine protease [Bacteroidales bacterium]
MNIIDEIKDSFKTGNNLTRLIYINVGIFLLIQLFIIFSRLFGYDELIYSIVKFLAVPTYLESLATHPWTVFSYMFTHKDFLHVLFNILWLYWFGRIFLSYFSERQLISVYILGGLWGAFLYIFSYNIFPGLQSMVADSYALGASASVMAIVIAVAFLVPDYKVYVVLIGPVKIIYVALIGFVLSSLIDFSVNTGGKIAHIGGAAFGYYFTYRYNHGKDISMWFSTFLDKFLSLFRRERKMKVTHKKPVSDYDYNKQKNSQQKEVDRILDKISKQGYDSLSKEEKEILFRMGK